MIHKKYELVTEHSWHLKERIKKDPIEQILSNRGLVTKSDLEKFLEPNFEKDFIDPFLLKDMKKVVKRLILAINNNQRIAIFGDYDADGIPATALFVLAFKKLKFNNYYTRIPTREEGYGLTEEVINKVVEQNCQLLITLDNGVTAKEAIEYGNKLGIETVIIDHHEIISDRLPQAFAIVNPKQPGCRYPEKYLCACALAFKTVWALYSQLDKNPQPLKWFLDLVAISSIADLVPLQGENRLLAYYGLMVLNKSRNLGLIKLIEKTGIKFGQINAYQVGFVIAPRLNAPNRLSIKEKQKTDQNIILELLTSEDNHRARDLAQMINDLNSARQEVLEKCILEARQQAIKQIEQGVKIIVLYDQKWPTGIVGLVASRLVDEFCRPAFIFGYLDGQLVGSARSIKAFHLVKKLEALSNLLEKFGGHAQAAGLTLKQANLDEFITKIQKIGSKSLSDSDLIKEFNIDLELQMDHLSLTLCHKIEKLNPFGLGNPQPVLKIKGQVSNLRVIGQNQTHISFLITDNKNKLKVLAWDGVSLAKKIDNKLIEVIGHLQSNIWQENESLQFVYLDHRFLNGGS